VNVPATCPPQTITASDLMVPVAAKALKDAMFQNTFMAGASTAMLNGILSAGQRVPAIGSIFGILKDLKELSEKYIESNHECQRLSVWCVSQIGTLGHLAKNASQVDEQTLHLIQSAIPPLLDLKKLVADRMSANQGYLGQFMSFWTSHEYVDMSRLAQEKVQSAIGALSFRVQVDTRKDVQALNEKCNKLLAMDQKLDSVLSLAREHSEKLDQVMKHVKKQDTKEKARERKEENLIEYEIKLADVDKKAQSFATGGTAEVFEAKMGRENVAVKVVHLAGMDMKKRKSLTKDFVDEVGILVKLRHPNILAVYGVITDDISCLQLVMEFADDGDLHGFLKSSVVPLSEEQQLDIALQIAAGMKYLHSRQVAHRDLKSPNVLMFKNSSGFSTCKISDFGLSKENIGVTQTATAGDNALGTPHWSAPEVLSSQLHTDYFKADAWSYGAVLFELATRQIPWGHMRSVLQVVTAVVVEKKTLTLQDSHYPSMISMLKSCCTHDAQARPSFEDIVSSLTKALNMCQRNMKSDV